MSLYGIVSVDYAQQVFILALSLAMLAVIVIDAIHYIIPNWLNFSLLMLYVVAALLMPLEWVRGVEVAAAVLLFGLLLFWLRVMGGGDIKLLVMLTLWVGWNPTLMHFLVLTAFCGGGLTIVLLILRSIVPQLMLRFAPGQNPPQILGRGQPIPYGPAIAFAFIHVLWRGNVEGLGAPNLRLLVDYVTVHMH